jgi:Flp pilus assembly protein TadG
MFIRRLKVRNKRCRSGTAVVEFAVLLPFITMVFLVGTDWCQIYYAATTVTDCARRGALAASGIDFGDRSLSESERITRGKAAATINGDTLNPPLVADRVTVTTSGDNVTVTITYDFHSTTGMMGFGDTWTISRSSTMPIHP